MGLGAFTYSVRPTGGKKWRRDAISWCDELTMRAFASAPQLQGYPRPVAVCARVLATLR